MMVLYDCPSPNPLPQRERAYSSFPSPFKGEGGFAKQSRVRAK